MWQQPSSNAEASLSICSLFESELLVRLMLHHWKHPRADDGEFGCQLLESATEVLQAAAADAGQVFIDGMPTSQMNLVAAIWYAETRALEEDCEPGEQTNTRKQWLLAVRRALPSCFCDPDEFV